MGELEIDFDPLHTLGFLWADWVEQHCHVPGGTFEGRPFTFTGWQLECTLNHGRVRPTAKVDPHKLLRPFHYRRSLVVGPQKSGKSPWMAGMALVEAVGPSQFAGWAKEGDIYRCSDHGCGCGWVYHYLPGEAMGKPRGKSLIALMASSEDQTQNVYEPLMTMVSNGPLSEFVLPREGFMRLPNRGLIQPVTASMRARLGTPYTAAFGDESGIYTPNTGAYAAWRAIRRAVSAMQGRTVECTNPWDPMENSAAQRTFESRAADVFKHYRRPPADLSYGNKRERSKIHRFVYSESPWVDPAAIDAEAAEIVETDPAEAERFFGNRLVQGRGSYLTEALWGRGERARLIEPGEKVAVGFDGSRSGDWTALRLETVDGFRFTPWHGPESNRRPCYWNPEEFPETRIPRGEVDAAVQEIFSRYDVSRMYIDPRHWETQADRWAALFGEDRVVLWPTNQISRMYPALVRFREDLAEGLTTHARDAVMFAQAMNARMVNKPGDKFVLGKPSEHQKIDLLMADVLAHEAAADMRQLGWVAERVEPKDTRVLVMR